MTDRAALGAASDNLSVESGALEQLTKVELPYSIEEKAE